MFLGKNVYACMCAVYVICFKVKTTVLETNRSVEKVSLLIFFKHMEMRDHFQKQMINKKRTGH